MERGRNIGGETWKRGERSRRNAEKRTETGLKMKNNGRLKPSEILVELFYVFV